jgi:hypothetical protein
LFSSLKIIPKLIILNPMLPITMVCDSSHPPTYKYSMIGILQTQGKIIRFTQNIKNKKMIWKLNSWIKPPFLDPSSLIYYSSPIFVHVPQQMESHFYLIKIINTIHILHCVAIATFIYTLCINYTRDYSGDVTFSLLYNFSLSSVHNIMPKYICKFTS